MVQLDDPVDLYLPALRGIALDTPLTVRHLYTHTNGLRLDFAYPGDWIDHWGDDLNDLEEVIAGYYPYLEVGKGFGYNGVGYALGGKVMEMVTGEAIPALYLHHLLYQNLLYRRSRK